MARPGITYDEVVAAIDAIIGAGDEPTIQKIRDQLGTGSPNTIHRHLTAWRSAQPVEQRKAPELPAELQAALVREIERQAADARSEVEKALVEAQKEAETLGKAGEELEEQNSVLAEHNEALAAEKERLTALADERHDEIEALKAELERERKAAEEARIQVAQGRNKIESLEQQINDQAAKMSETLAEAKTAQIAQVSAEKAAAVAEAKLSERLNVETDLRERLAAAQTQIKESQNQINSTNSELVAAMKKIANLERALGELKNPKKLE